MNDWEYKSDNDQTKIYVGRKLHNKNNSLNEMIIYFTEIWSTNKEKHLRSLLKCDSEGNLKMIKNEQNNIEKLVDKFNVERENRVINKHTEKTKKTESVLLKNTNNIMQKFIENLQVISKQ